MESSRIFIRGLPPSLTEEDFKKHFSKQSSITDAKFIPRRRIGYVGYKNPEDAAKAVKHHNRTFIRMSKIGVELARSVEDQVLQPRRNATNVGALKSGTGVESFRKRKPEITHSNVGSAKLQEFLQVMQPPSKSKTWENEEEMAMGTHPLDTNAKQVPMRETEEDEEYEDVLPPKKKARKEKRAPDPELSPPAEAPTSEKDVVVEKDTDNVPNATATSDVDWLRSRSSRLLGLVDDDDAIGSAKLPQDGEKQKSENPQQSGSGDRSDASVQAIEDVDEEEPTQTAPPPQFKKDGTANGHGRLFVRNLTYTTTEDNLREHFQSYGELEEVHLPIDFASGHNKGFAHIQYSDPEASARALQKLDRRPFQGRLLHVMFGNPKKEQGLDEFAISKLPLKKQHQIRRKAEAASSAFNWNSMYMNSDAIMSSISDRLGISKSELLDPTSSDAAITQAHAETHIIQETRTFFGANGVDLDAFKRRERGNTAILIKNFAYGTKPEELRRLFEYHGRVTKLIMPPSGIISIVEFEQADHAKSAFGSLAYRKFKDSILFLEKAPKDLFFNCNGKASQSAPNGLKAKTARPVPSELLEGKEAQEPAGTSTLFVRNLNFSTTTDRLREVFEPLDGFLAAKVKTKTDNKKPGHSLSMGFGFLEFKSKKQAQSTLAAMDGYKLDGHELLIRESQKPVDAAERRRKEDQAKKAAGRKTKIIIKNLPFEATKKDIRALFGPYGQLSSVRVPKKFDSTTRGFAFADFVTAREAENAIDALKDTHLLGRRMILEFAAHGTSDPEVEIEKMQQKVGKQADKVALQRLTGSGRKKFNVEGADDLDQN